MIASLKDGVPDDISGFHDFDQKFALRLLYCLAIRKKKLAKSGKNKDILTRQNNDRKSQNSTRFAILIFNFLTSRRKIKFDEL